MTSPAVANRAAAFWQVLLRGKPLRDTFIKTASPRKAGIVGGLGFDVVVIDEQDALRQATAT